MFLHFSVFANKKNENPKTPSQLDRKRVFHGHKSTIIRFFLQNIHFYEYLKIIYFFFNTPILKTP